MISQSLWLISYKNLQSLSLVHETLLDLPVDDKVNESVIFDFIEPFFYKYINYMASAR